MRSRRDAERRPEPAAVIQASDPAVATPEDCARREPVAGRLLLVVYAVAARVLAAAGLLVRLRVVWDDGRRGRTSVRAGDRPRRRLALTGGLVLDAAA